MGTELGPIEGVPVKVFFMGRGRGRGVHIGNEILTEAGAIEMARRILRHFNESEA